MRGFDEDPASRIWKERWPNDERSIWREVMPSGSGSCEYVMVSSVVDEQLPGEN